MVHTRTDKSTFHLTKKKCIVLVSWEFDPSKQSAVFLLWAFDIQDNMSFLSNCIYIIVIIVSQLVSAFIHGYVRQCFTPITHLSIVVVCQRYTISGIEIVFNSSRGHVIYKSRMSAFSLKRKLKCITLQWRHNEPDGISNHQPRDCLLKRLFRRRSKKTSKLCVTVLCVGNSPVTGEFPAQMASNAEFFSIWWRHREYLPPSSMYSLVWYYYSGTLVVMYET